MSEGINRGADDDPTLRPLINLLGTLEGSTASDGPAGGHEQASLSMVKMQLVQEVEAGVATLRQQLATGETPDPKAVSLSYALADMARAAAAVGDHETFALHLDTLLQLPDVPSSAMASACFAGIQIRNQRALDSLREALHAEKIQEAARERTPITALLHATLNECADHDASPDAWVTDFGIDAPHRWQLLSNYYVRLARRTDGETRNEQQYNVEALTAQLLRKGAFPSLFVFEQVWYELAKTQNPELRTYLVQAFMSSGDTVHLNSYTFDMLNWMGVAVLDDPQLATHKTVNYFTQTIEACGQRLQGAGMPIYDVVSRQLHWRTKLALHNGMEPEDVIDMIDLQTSSLLAADIPDGQDDLGQNLIRNREYAEHMRAILLSLCAQHFASQGDFVTAKLYLPHILNEADQMVALGACLDKATTTEDIDAIRPDTLTIRVTPNLGRLIRFAEAKLTGDTAKLTAITKECAHIVQKEDVGHNRHLLRSAYEALAERDGPQAIQTAKELLSILRQGRKPSHQFTYLTNALLVAGDPDEAARAKAYIEQSAKHRYEQLQDMWELSKVL